MKTLFINLYSFSELSKGSQNKAFNNHLEFLNSLQNTCNEFENLTRSDVIDSIEMNDYLFFADGEIAPCTTYTGKHRKSGITELNLQGEIYTIK